MSANEQPSYYAIIPANVRYDNDLKANEKLLYGEITCLSQSTGKCFASNEYFSNLYGVSKETVSRWVSHLSSKGYIQTQLIYKEGTKQIIKRYIQINQEGHDEKVNTPIDEKVKDNNTSINNTRVIDKKVNKPFSFNLPKLMSFDQLSEEYKTNLKAYIDNHNEELTIKRLNANSPLSDEYTYKQMETDFLSSGKKQKDFRATFNKWKMYTYEKESDRLARRKR